MLSGELPQRNGEKNLNCEFVSDKIMVEVNGSREEMEVADAISFAARILALAEVIIRNG